MFRTVGSFIGSQGFGNTLLILILLVSSINLFTSGRILESVRKGETPPMSSPHTVTVGSNSITFTITTPWRSDDTGATLAERHWENVQAAIAKFTEMLGS